MRKGVVRALAIPLALAGAVAATPAASAEPLPAGLRTVAGSPDGGVPARAGKQIEMWDGPANMRSGPTSWDSVVGQAGPGVYWADCQRTGQTIYYRGNRSENWSHINNNGVWGYVANVFVKGPDPVPGLGWC
ncbi:hypothetical protein AB0395_31585 [Streptosporangium sp. NPDC051023]|uniref:SH3 domain-containing protein n=1 Tax=Streptosporangium sp. NPDC051023 TaxID=3155410 RepID=UPI003450390B